jgi:hypothetical protein
MWTSKSNKCHYFGFTRMFVVSKFDWNTKLLITLTRITLTMITVTNKTIDIIMLTTITLTMKTLTMVILIMITLIMITFTIITINIMQLTMITLTMITLTIHFNLFLFQTTSVSGELSTSTLTYTPQANDSGKILHCRATNPEMERGILEDAWELNVQCKQTNLMLLLLLLMMLSLTSFFWLLLMLFALLLLLFCNNKKYSCELIN